MLKARHFCDLWALPDLAEKVHIDFSNCLKSSWGRSSVENRSIRLHPDLALADEELVDEVLCHELAHIAVYEKYGPGKRPHGGEWASFVREAGFDPKLGLRATGGPKESMEGKRKRFEHFCPVCQSVKYARQPISQWRCSRCMDAGLEGKLVVRESKRK